LPAPVPAAASGRRRLSFKEQRELEQLPARIEALEADIAALTAQLQDPNFYAGGTAAVTAANARLTTLQAELDAAYARWSELE
jgi:ATP-binding cassette subfamily F protein uup